MANVAELETLIKARAVIKSKLTRFKNNLNKFESETDDKRILLGRFEKFEPIYSEYDLIQTQIDLLFDDDPDGLEDQLRVRDEFEASYFVVRADAKRVLQLQDQVRSLTEVNRSNSNIAGTSQDTQSQSSAVDIAQLLSASNLAQNLPKLTIPSFDGSFKDWVKFRDTFKTMVHERAGISNIEKFHYLSTALTGDAARVIQSLGISDSNYELAWKGLTERYEDSGSLVHYHVKSLFEISNLTKSSYISLRQLVDDVNNHIVALNSLGEKTEHWDTMIIYLISTKLDPASKREWERILVKSEKATYKTMLEFLENHCKFLQRVTVEKPESSTPNQGKKANGKINNNPKPSEKLTAHATVKRNCSLCQESHALYQCEKFRALPVTSRIDEVRKLRICFNCLTPGHHNKQCYAGPCKKCRRKHNTLLHNDNYVPTNVNSDNIEGVSEQTDHPGSANDHLDKVPRVSNSLVARPESSDTNHVLLGTAIVWIKDHQGKLHECRALLDSCSQVNIMTRSFSQRLKLPKLKSNIVVSGVFKSSQEPQHSVQVIMNSRCTGYSKSLSCLIAEEITDDMPNISLRKGDFQVPNGITMADPLFAETRPVDLLIGGSIFWNLICVGQIQLYSEQPIFQKTQLGWIVVGTIQPQTRFSSSKSVCNLITTQQLHNEVKQFWEIEHHAPKKCRPELDSRDICEQYFLSTTERDTTGRYIVSIPFKDEVNELGDSFFMAQKRLFAIERKLKRDPQLKDKYTEFLKDYVEQGHMTLIPPEELNKEKSVNYLPHHSVVKECSTTTKVRVVFDVSAKTSSGLSLNEVQRVGPVVQNDLFSIVLRFRQHRVVLSADITQMYRQILIKQDQQDFQRILWRFDPEGPIQHFRLRTVTYGTSSAPFLATRVLRQIGEENKEVFPIASPVIVEDFYVDDLLTGTNTVEEARLLKKELETVLRASGMELRKWASNESRVLKEEDHANSEKSIQTDKDPKTLGLLWTPETDKLKYSVLETLPAKATKRIILSIVAQIFDPLGLVGPIVIRAKLILQKLWELQIKWDESLPQDLNTLWLNFAEQLKSLKKIEIPRFVLVTDSTTIQLHGFCDASEAAYGACIYIRSSDQSGHTITRLLCAKSRVAPIKRLTLPRLELQGALLLAQLVETVSSALTLTIKNKYFWCDSTITLGWIQSSPSRWPTFIANRTSEIQNLTNENWNHVSSSDNPADLISRGTDPSSLRTNQQWWKGPAWLSQSMDNWPTKRRFSNEEIDNLPEQRTTKRVFIVTTPTDFSLLERYSSLNRLVRITAYCLRFISNVRLKKKGERKLNFLEASERTSALNALLKLAQIQHFSQEISDIEQSKQVSKRSTLRTLNPFIDSVGLLRVGGRLTHAPLSFDARHPIILSSKNVLTSLLISNEHIKLMHAGCQAVISSLRSRYWPLSCKNTVKGILRKCVTCFRARPLSVEYIMGNLPTARVTPKRPFYTCGVDYAGPYQIKAAIRSRITMKSYICIFVCFATKAVHIELAHDLSTMAFLNCLRRFISRRGKCQRIYSDNGTNFVGARNVLNELNVLLTNTDVQRTITDFLAQDQISWHLIPPNAPHFGGLWESAVKSAKKHLTRVIGQTQLTYEELYTVLTQVEACLNSRPLTPLSTDPKDLNPLTPGHFLIGDSLVAVPQPDLTDAKETRLSRYEHLQYMVQHFWQRWQREYLCQLQQRYKWSNSTNYQLVPGIMVLIREDNLPPLKWQIGRIIEVYPGKDNVVRVVKVRTASSTYERPATKMCILPFEQNLIQASNETESVKQK